MHTDRYVDEARTYAKQARRMAGRYADDAGGRLRRGAHDMQAGAEYYADAAGSRIADHPLPYVLVAALLGFVFGRLFKA